MILPPAPTLKNLDALVPSRALIALVEDGPAQAFPLRWIGVAVSRLHEAGIPLRADSQPLLTVTDNPSVPAVVAVLPTGDINHAKRKAAEAVALLQGCGCEAATVVFSNIAPDLVQAVAEGVLSANWRLETEYGSARGRRPLIRDIEFAVPDAESFVAERLHVGWLISKACLSARHLATQPANELTPPIFAEHCRVLASAAGFSIQIMDRAQLQEANMGGLLAAGAGSRYGPLLIRIDWRPPQAEGQKPLVLVGKTVTFDSGGISLKKPEEMHRMKADMGGGAAVFGAMTMIADLQPSFPVTAIFPVVENVLGPDAMRPGDVVRVASGATVEIINTDAEGRLILADALHTAASLEPTVIIDLATLTGASMGIFGPIGIGTFANDEFWFARLAEADRMAGEKIWRLPLWPEYRSYLASPVADLRNYSTTGQNGSTMVAAAFLSHFVGKNSWLHLDLYNTCWNAVDTPFLPEGPTGSGTRVLSQLILNLQNGSPNIISHSHEGKGRIWEKK